MMYGLLGFATCAFEVFAASTISLANCTASSTVSGFIFQLPAMKGLRAAMLQVLARACLACKQPTYSRRRPDHRAPCPQSEQQARRSLTELLAATLRSCGDERRPGEENAAAEASAQVRRRGSCMATTGWASGLLVIRQPSRRVSRSRPQKFRPAVSGCAHRETRDGRAGAAVIKTECGDSTLQCGRHYIPEHDRDSSFTGRIQVRESGHGPTDAAPVTGSL
jgi:hypothetical protein